jgi:hypothetical protein
VRIKAGRHQDEVWVEIDDSGQDLVPPRAAPQGGVCTRALDAHFYEAGAIEGRVVCCGGRELMVWVLLNLVCEVVCHGVRCV